MHETRRLTTQLPSYVLPIFPAIASHQNPAGNIEHRWMRVPRNVGVSGCGCPLGDLGSWVDAKYVWHERASPTKSWLWGTFFIKLARGWRIQSFSICIPVLQRLHLQCVHFEHKSTSSNSFSQPLALSHMKKHACSTWDLLGSHRAAVPTLFLASHVRALGGAEVRASLWAGRWLYRGGGRKSTGWCHGPLRWASSGRKMEIDGEIEIDKII